MDSAKSQDLTASSSSSSLDLFNPSREKSINSPCLAFSVIDPDYPSTSKSHRGCRVCTFLDRIIEFHGRDSRWLVKGSTVIYRTHSDSGGFQKEFELFTREESHPQIIFREILPDPLSDTSCAIVQSWLDSCFNTHEICQPSTDFELPTRVIDVSEPKLRLSELQLKNTKYVTLSHCWGDKPVLLTTLKSLESHKKHVEFSDLPLNFQDAVTVTRKLGVSYLWIDSICIIQDCENDWLTECARMADYYRNSYVTISALEAVDSHQGFLAPRPISDAVKLPNSPNVCIRPKTVQPRQIFRDAALNSRGWAFQERLLSSRVLHFTQHGMLWECQTLSASESSNMGQQATSTDFRSLVQSDGEDFKRSLCSIDSDRFSERNGVFILWQRLVRQYSRRKLSHSSDRLPAISGLAAMLACKTKCKYIAGLWEENTQGFAWFRGNLDSPPHKIQSFDAIGVLAPSWSWASMNQPITYRFDDGDEVKSHKDAVLIASDIRTQGQDSFGSILHGSIVLKALVQTVRIRQEEERQLFNPIAEVLETLDGAIVGSAYFDHYIKTTHETPGTDKVPLKAARIAERCFDGPVSDGFFSRDVVERVVYFLILTPDTQESGGWKRLGIGMTRNYALTYRSREFYSDFFEGCEWEELRLL